MNAPVYSSEKVDGINSEGSTETKQEQQEPYSTTER